MMAIPRRREMPPTGTAEVACFVCGAYLGTIGLDGSYMRFPPCKCGWQWVGEAVGRRGRRTAETPAGSIEIKTR